jgi:hypothetical protein
VNTIIGSVQQKDPKRASPVRVERAYIYRTGRKLCVARIKSAFEMTSIQRGNVTLFMPVAGEITIRQPQVKKQNRVTLAGLGSAARGFVTTAPTFCVGHAKSDNRGEANGRCTAVYRGECESVNGKS